MKSLKNNPKIFLWAFRTAFSRNPLGYLFYFVLNVASVTLGVFISIFVGHVINNITGNNIVEAGISPLVWMIVSICIFEMLGKVVDGIYWRYVQDIMPQNYRIKSQKQIVDMVRHINLEWFDKQEFQEEYDRFCKAYGDLDNMVTGIISIIAHIYRQVAVAILVASINVWFSVIAVSFLVIGIIIEMKSVSYNKQIRKDATFDCRLAGYYDSMFVGNNRDTRLLGLTDTFIERYIYHNRQATDIQRNIWKKKDTFNAMIFPVANKVASLAIILLGLFLISKGKLEIGLFYTAWSLSSSSVSQSQNLQRALSFYSDSVTIAFEAHMFIEKYIKTSNVRDGAFSDDLAPIEIEHLTFSYRDNDIVLNDISLSIKKGESIALVGENGSGKSTLIKCILGLYKPTAGHVRLFGTDASKIPEEDIGKRVGVTFQDFNKYTFSLRENVGFGDLSKIHNDSKIKEAIRKAGAQDVLEQCHGELSTVLDRTLDSDGTALSGGQWQKLALARTYISDKDIMIFDEPGAALDPISELEQFEEIRSKIKGKTSILVSHRIGFAKMADRIIVLKNGKIVESGCHDFLMEQNGEYAHLYNEQKQWYEKQEVKRYEKH